MIKLFEEFENFNLRLSSSDLYFARIKELEKKNLDMDVYLPTKKINLQRENVWDIRQKRELIISLLIGRKIPSISVMSVIDRSKPYSSMSDDTLQIIDGKQRLSTFIEYYNNGFDIVTNNKNYFYKDLPEKYRLRYMYYDVRCEMAYEDIDVPFTDDQKIKWFRLINFAGTPQDNDHIEKLKSTKN